MEVTCQTKTQRVRSNGIHYLFITLLIHYYQSEHQPMNSTNLNPHSCIGSVAAQETLSRMSKILCEGGTVQTKIEPEQDNQYDANAIAFMCRIDDKWNRIGYIVRECLEHVHLALSERRILAVKISWAKYLTCWSRSGPAFYAGVNISIRGEQHRDAICSQSSY